MGGRNWVRGGCGQELGENVRVGAFCFCVVVVLKSVGKGSGEGWCKLIDVRKGRTQLSMLQAV